MAAEWSSQYEYLKKRLQSLRLQKIEYSSDEIRALNNSLNNLENQLRLMSESPNRFDLYASEVARRQLILEHLKKQMADVKNMNSSPNRPAYTAAGNSNAGGGAYVSPSSKTYALFNFWIYVQCTIF
jgi:chromosome segregation ATPase